MKIVTKILKNILNPTLKTPQLLDTTNASSKSKD